MSVPDCPLCSQPPGMILDSGKQCFCLNPECPTLTWDSTKTMDELMSDINHVDLRGWA